MHDNDDDLRELFGGAGPIDQERFEHVRTSVRREFERKKKKLTLLCLFAQLLAIGFMSGGGLLLRDAESTRAMLFGVCMMAIGFGISLLHAVSFLQNTTHLDVLKAIRELHLSLRREEQQEL